MLCVCDKVEMGAQWFSLSKCFHQATQVADWKLFFEVLMLSRCLVYYFKSLLRQQWILVKQSCVSLVFCCSPALLGCKEWFWALAPALGWAPVWLTAMDAQHCHKLAIATQVWIQWREMNMPNWLTWDGAGSSLATQPAPLWVVGAIPASNWWWWCRQQHNQHRPETQLYLF